jgi:hypothetical protein
MFPLLWVHINQTEATKMSKYIGKKIKVEGFTIKGFNELSRVYIVAKIDDEQIITKCGHTIELAWDRTVYGANNRRVMTEARVCWDSAQ